MLYEIDDSTIYYFLCPAKEKYYNLFLGFLRPELISAFKELDDENGTAFMKIKVGLNLFIAYVDKPVFVIEYEKEGIFRFAGDNMHVELFPGTEPPENTDLPTVIEFPSYFNKGIEPYLDFKLGKEFCINEGGVWVPLDL